MGFGQQLRTWRERAGIKQAELERAIGKSRGYLTRVEDGSIAPTREACTALAAELRRSDTFILSDDEVWSAAVLDAADPAVREHYEAQLASLRAEYEQRVSAIEAGGSLARLLETVTAAQAEVDRIRGAHPGKTSPIDVADCLRMDLADLTTSAVEQAEACPDVEARDGIWLARLYHALVVPMKLPTSLRRALNQSATASMVSLYNAWMAETKPQRLAKVKP